MASDAVSGAGAEIRENLVTTAIQFLTNPSIKRCTLESKERFLRSKGLSEPEIQKAIEKCTEIIDVPSMTSELMFVHQSRRSWFKDNVLPILVYGGFAYGCYWFYKNYVRHMLFVEQPKRKSTAECIDELRKSVDILNANVTSLRSEIQVNAHQSALRSQLDNIKSDLSSVKGILLNRNQFPTLKTRSDLPSIPAWQRQSQDASTEATSEEKKKSHRSRSQRSESGGSNSSEGEQATKNSDSSLEIISPTDYLKRERTQACGNNATSVPEQTNTNIDWSEYYDPSVFKTRSNNKGKLYKFTVVPTQKIMAPKPVDMGWGEPSSKKPKLYDTSSAKPQFYGVAELLSLVLDNLKSQPATPGNTTT